MSSTSTKAVENDSHYLLLQLLLAQKATDTPRYAMVSRAMKRNVLSIHCSIDRLGLISSVLVVV